jgi:hypothetical protein
MKNLILGIIALGVIGACNSEPKEKDEAIANYEQKHKEVKLPPKI